MIVIDRESDSLSELKFQVANRKISVDLLVHSYGTEIIIFGRNC